jgi:hypothetical protein
VTAVGSPLSDRALDKASDAPVGSLEQQAIRAAAAAGEHAEPGEEAPRGWLALDDEQLIDRADREAALRSAVADLDGRIVDVDLDLARQHAARRDRHGEAQDRLARRHDAAVRGAQPGIRVERLDANVRWSRCHRLKV